MEFGLLKLANDEHMQQLMAQHRQSYDAADEKQQAYEDARGQYGEHVGVPERIMRGASLVGAPIAGALLGHGLGGKLHADTANAGGVLGTIAGGAAGYLGQRGIRSMYDGRDEERVPLREEKQRTLGESTEADHDFFNAFEDVGHAADGNPTAYRSLAGQNPHEADALVLDSLRQQIRQRRLEEQEDRHLNRETMRSTRDLNRSQLEG